MMLRFQAETNFRRLMKISERKTPARRLVLTERDCEIPQLAQRFGILSRDQIKALCRFGSITRVNTRSAALVKAGILQRKTLPVYPGHGSAQALYALGKESFVVLPGDMQEIAQQVRRVGRWDLQQVEHVQAANQVLVDFISALRRNPESALIAFRTELELRRLLVNRSLVPDGWIAWTAQGKRFNCFIEVDLHHEGLTVWRRKILEYVSFAQCGLHQELFGFRAFRVLVLAKSRARLENLRRIAVEAGQLFRFADLGAVRADTILNPVWLPASGSVALALTGA
jgi:hypothetical protein